MMRRSAIPIWVQQWMLIQRESPHGTWIIQHDSAARVDPTIAGVIVEMIADNDR